MEKYQSIVRPVNNETDTVNVSLAFSLTTVVDLDEKDQVFVISGIIKSSWKDVQLEWDPRNYGGLTIIRFPISQLWYPDIVVANSKDSFYGPPIHHLAVVSFDGTVLWIPQVNIETHCAVDLSEFPFDEQVCYVKFLSWTYDESQVNITIMDGSHTSDWLFINNNEWEIKEITSKRNSFVYACCDEAYPDITYYFTIKRRTTFTTHLFLGPSVILCLITPTIFLLPPGSGEKTIVGIGVVVADTILLGELIDFVPAAHPNVPLLVKYFVGNIVMACLSVALSTIIIGCWDKSKSRLTEPPAFFRLLILGPVARFLCVRKEDYQPLDDTNAGATLEITTDGSDGSEVDLGVEPKAEKRRRCMDNYLRNAARSEWRQLAVVFDRLFFAIYCVILSLLTLSFARYM